MSIAQALVTEPPLMALVVSIGVSVGAALSLFVIDMNRQIRERER